jgi:tetratricopeptide (TPR) repeat protein
MLLRLFLTLCMVTATLAGAGTPSLDPAITFLEKRVAKDPDDFVAQNQLASRYLELLRVTGDDQYRVKARKAAEASVAVNVPELNNGGIAALARVQLASHQFAEARDNAKKLRVLAPGKTYSFGILGDALLELGEYDEAATAFSNLAKGDENGLDSEPRLAQLAVLRGELTAAKEHFNNALEAAKALNPPAPSLLAWCRVQLGQLFFNQGDWENADKNYRAALEALPDYWSALDHVAELCAARQQYPEAIGIYTKLIERVPRPELCQAVGDIYTFMAKPAEAKAWYERAATGYVNAGALYQHHLAGFYSDSVEDPERAIKWARQDLDTRHGIFAHDSMAWALYRNGQFAEAAAEMKRALILGTKDSHLLFHASMIATATGDVAKGKEFLEKAAAVNPHYYAFHVHR